ncbi:MAG: site-2 protease family protein [Candidatus Diapherotrites archaeon]
MNFIELVLVFAVVSVIFTYALKKFFKVDTWIIVSLIKTKKPLALMKRLSKYKKFWDALATAGLILGFGAIAVDYLKGKKCSAIERTALILISVILLGLFFIGFDLLLNQGISRQSKELFWVFVLVFGLTGFSGLSIALLVQSASGIIMNYFIGIKSCPGVAPLIPGVEIPGVPITAPMHAWISLFLIILIHEGAHGITAFANKIKIKSAGVVLLGFLPIGAFVEPPENEFNELSKKEPLKVLKVLSAGPTANLLALALIIFMITGFSVGAVYLFGGWAMPIKENMIQGAKITEVQEFTELCGQKYENTAFGKIDANSPIVSINSTEINSVNEAIMQLTLTDKAEFELINPEGKQYSVELEKNKAGTYGIMLANIENPDYNPPKEYLWYSQAILLAVEFLSWFLILNLLLAIINFMPFAIFDGGRMAGILLLPYFSFIKKPEEEKEKLIKKILTNAILILLLINALPLFI